MYVPPSQLGHYPHNYATLQAYRLPDSSTPEGGCTSTTEAVSLTEVSKLRTQKHSQRQPLGLGLGNASRGIPDCTGST